MYVEKVVPVDRPVPILVPYVIEKIVPVDRVVPVVVQVERNGGATSRSARAGRLEQCEPLQITCHGHPRPRGLLMQQEELVTTEVVRPLAIAWHGME